MQRRVYPHEEFLKNVDDSIPLEESLKQLYHLCGGTNYSFFCSVPKLLYIYMNEFVFTIWKEDRIKINDTVYNLI